MTDLVNIQDEKELEFRKITENMDTILEGKEIVVKNHEDLGSFHKILLKIKEKWKEIEALRKSETSLLDELKKKIQNRYKPHLDWLKEKEDLIKAAQSKYIVAEQTRLKAVQDKLDEAARKEEEKKKQALEERAKKAEEKGDTEKAEELRDKADNVQVLSVVINTEVKGIPTREKYTATVVDFALLPKEYKIEIVFQEALDVLAKATKGTAKVPGVVFKCETIIIGK